MLHRMRQEVRIDEHRVRGDQSRVVLEEERGRYLRDLTDEFVVCGLFLLLGFGGSFELVCFAGGEGS